MKRVLMALCMVLVFSTVLFAQQPPPNYDWCATVTLGQDQTCRNLHWTDLGTFNPNGTFNFTYSRLGQLLAQFNQSTEADITPYKVFTVPAQKRRLYANVGTNTQETRIDFELPTEVIYHPIIAEITNPGDPDWVSFAANFLPPEGCNDSSKTPPDNLFGICVGPGTQPLNSNEISCTDPYYLSLDFDPPLTCPDDRHPNPCCRTWTKINMNPEQGSPVEFGQIEKVTWGELEASPLKLIRHKRWNVSYDLTQSQSGRYNFWRLNGQNDVTEVSAYFEDVIPASGAENIFKVKLSGGIEIPLKFMEMDTSVFPPIIPLYTLQNATNPSGKALKQTYSVQNIVSREKDGNLIIQWPEPDILGPNTEMFVYVGIGDLSLSGPPEVTDIYVFVDSPSQLGTVVIPWDVWTAVKGAMKYSGSTEARCVIQYRYRWLPTSSDESWSAIRSRSDALVIPLQ